MQEIISVYNLLNPSQLTAAASNRVCNALALLQCVASHNDTRTLFLNGTHYVVIFRWISMLTNNPSSHTSLPLSIFEYNVQVPTFRIPPLDLSRRDWRPS